MNIPPGVWRLDAIVMGLYQLALFFAAQLIIVNFLEYTPKTYCNNADFCYKTKDKCLDHYDREAPNLCNKDSSDFNHCVKEMKYVYYDSAQLQYQHDCENWSYYFSATTAMYIGVLLSSLVLGVLADRFGRRPIFFVAVGFGVIGMVGAAALPGVKWYYIFRVITGVGVAGAQVVGWSYGSELISAKRRFQLRTFSNWANARILIALVAIITQDWHYSLYLCALIVLCIVPILWYLPESPLFLEQKKKTEKALKAREKIEKITKIPNESKNDAPKNLKKITFFSMLKNQRLKKNFYILCFMWFYVGMATYITDLNGGDMSKNIYIGQLLSGIILTISKIAIGLFEPHAPWFGRRMMFFISQGIAIVAYVGILIALYTNNKDSWWYLVMYVLAYSFQQMCTETLYLSVAELMPTDVRATAAAIMNILLRVGTIVASTTKPLKYSYEPGLFWINLVVCCFGVVAVYRYLEESRNANLQNVGQEEIKESDKSKSVASSSKTSIASEKSGKSEKSTKSTKSVKKGLSLKKSATSNRSESITKTLISETEKSTKSEK
ncbi:unnamed protein product [Caenorhabditis angaria]|uniref:Major facilitator superfamily (MFS) profile domain-containing protein n=1 Tax=Caenorhabditis angaria TaxID=860376 RepID=A0A9P1N5R2_9PELO|nr:unnamed protein product [Caenorhabditis angaria]